MKVWCLVVVVLALPGSAYPQGDARSLDRTTAAESVETRRSVERAARTFEQRRLRLVPDVPSSGGGAGDVIIGRYRYAAGEADDLSPPPAEPPEIAELRRSLLHTLGSASQAMPGDSWIRSRLVWYAIEAGDTALSVSAARECRDDDVAWWCHALLGLALHASHRFVDAERAFDQALVAMPDSTRCRWTDASLLLEGKPKELIERTPCEQRATLNERLWWLADPFHSIEGNELRAEHFARHAFTVLHDRWRATHPLGWGSDMREIVLRYAWPVAWSRDRSRERAPTQPGYYLAITGHEPNPAYDFFPDASALESPSDASDTSWHFRRSRATTHYAHPLAAPMQSLRHQIARFRRGDSLLIIGAWSASHDTVFNRAPGRAALVASSGDHTAFIARSDGAAARGALTLGVPNIDQVVSVELFSGSSRAAGRARQGVRASLPASGLALSDILLVEPDERPRTLTEAVEHLLADGQLGAERRVTLFWEVYGLETGALPRVTVSVSRIRASRARRLAEKLGLRDEPQTVHADWAADAPAAQTAAGSLTLDLRDRPAGTWRVSITVTAGDGNSATAQRDLVLGTR
jgi:hypothetical protein